MKGRHGDHLINAALMAALVLGSVLALDDLSGSAYSDGPAARKETPPAPFRKTLGAAVLSTAMLYGLAWLVRSKPHWINTPNQKKFNARSPEARRAVARPIVRGTYWIVPVLLFLFGIEQAGAYQAARSSSGERPDYLIVVLPFTIVLLNGIALTVIVLLHNAVERLYKQEQAGASRSKQEQAGASSIGRVGGTRALLPLSDPEGDVQDFVHPETVLISGR